MDFFHKLANSIAESLYYSAEHKLNEARLGKEKAAQLKKERCLQKQEKNRKTARQSAWLLTGLTILICIVPSGGLVILAAPLIWFAFYGIARMGNNNPYK
jgi:hypothetical protein